MTIYTLVAESSQRVPKWPLTGGKSVNGGDFGLCGGAGRPATSYRAND